MQTSLSLWLAGGREILESAFGDIVVELLRRPPSKLALARPAISRVTASGRRTRRRRRARAKENLAISRRKVSYLKRGASSRGLLPCEICRWRIRPLAEIPPISVGKMILSEVSASSLHIFPEMWPSARGR